MLARKGPPGVSYRDYIVLRYEVASIRNTSEQLSTTQFQLLADFRIQLRQFLHFTEEVARANGIEPQQYQALLTIGGLPDGLRPTVSVLAQRLSIRHHSAVELIDRLVERNLVVRRAGEEDRREVLIEITKEGSGLLRKLAALHWHELQKAGPALSGALNKILTAEDANGANDDKKRTNR